MRILILEDSKERHEGFVMKLCGPVKRRNTIKIVETAKEAMQELLDYKWDLLFLDHDLGGEVNVASGPGTGYEVASWLEQHRKLQPKYIVIHSFNPEGAKQMSVALPKAILLPGAWTYSLEDILKKLKIAVG